MKSTCTSTCRKQSLKKRPSGGLKWALASSKSDLNNTILFLQFHSSKHCMKITDELEYFIALELMHQSCHTKGLIQFVPSGWLIQARNSQQYSANVGNQLKTILTLLSTSILDFILSFLSSQESCCSGLTLCSSTAKMASRYIVCAICAAWTTGSIGINGLICYPLMLNGLIMPFPLKISLQAVVGTKTRIWQQWLHVLVTYLKNLPLPTTFLQILFRNLYLCTLLPYQFTLHWH